MSFILYASPLGAIAEACHKLWDEFEKRGLTTTAQTYPPHVTLTGFFDVAKHRVADVRAQTDGWINGLARQRPNRFAPTVDHGEGADWVGLLVRSDVLQDLARDFAAAVEPLVAVRLKTDLHLSLAYGKKISAEHRKLIHEHFGELSLHTRNWELALWERDDARAWTRLASTTLSFG